MEVIVGHFGYLEYISEAEISFPFPREIVSYARTVVNQARGGLLQKTQILPVHPPEPQYESVYNPIYPLPDVSAHDKFIVLLAFLTRTLSVQLLTSNDCDLDFEDWPSFMPSFSGVSSMMLGNIQ